MNQEEIKVLKNCILAQQNKISELNHRAIKLRTEADNLNAEARGINIAIDSFSLTLKRLEEEAERKERTPPE